MNSAIKNNRYSVIVTTDGHNADIKCYIYAKCIELNPKLTVF